MVVKVTLKLAACMCINNASNICRVSESPTKRTVLSLMSFDMSLDNDTMLINGLLCMLWHTPCNKKIPVPADRDRFNMLAETKLWLLGSLVLGAAEIGLSGPKESRITSAVSFQSDLMWSRDVFSVLTVTFSKLM